MLPLFRGDASRRESRLRNAVQCCVHASVRAVLRYGIFVAFPLLVAALITYDILRSRINLNRDYKYPMGFIYWPVPDAYPLGLNARKLQTLFVMYRLNGMLRFALMEALDYTFFPLWGVSLLSFAHYTLIAGVSRRIGPLLVPGPRLIRLLLWLTVLGTLFDSIENTLTLRAATHYQKLMAPLPLKIRNLACNAKFVCLAGTLVLLALLVHVEARLLLHAWRQRSLRKKAPELTA